MTATPPSPSLGLPIVYLVDDEDVVRDALGWLLRSRRLLSEGFASAEAFEAMLAAKTPAALAEWPVAPSCLLLDVRMPGMSGLSLFERLVERGLIAALPVIFLTGHGDVPTAVAAVKRGAFDFVEKPFSNNALVDRIEQALAASAAAIGARRERARRRRDFMKPDRKGHVLRRYPLRIGKSFRALGRRHESKNLVAEVRPGLDRRATVRLCHRLALDDDLAIVSALHSSRSRLRVGGVGLDDHLPLHGCGRRAGGMGEPEQPPRVRLGRVP